MNQVEEKIKALLDEKWLEPDFSDCFLVEIILKGNKLEVYLDSDTAITFEKCKKVSRVLEAYLDETKVLGAEYTLEVSSAGVGKPLLMPRQFEKISRGSSKYKKLTERISTVYYLMLQKHILL
ncbi:MAG: hypothetical protein IPI60_02010 [Saprospiraceae bacterium]|nr:hypothetical protein [Saprospiraceae bacterium]